MLLGNFLQSHLEVLFWKNSKCEGHILTSFWNALQCTAITVHLWMVEITMQLLQLALEVDGFAAWWLDLPPIP